MLTQSSESSESSERASAASRKQDGQEVHDGQEGSPSPTAKPVLASQNKTDRPATTRRTARQRSERSASEDISSTKGEAIGRNSRHDPRRGSKHATTGGTGNLSAEKAAFGMNKVNPEAVSRPVIG